MSGEPEYNPLFERFVDPERPHEDLKGLVAYGLYKVAKREWATSIRERHGRGPSEAELEGYIRSWTPSRIAGAMSEAESVLATFANAAIEDQAPTIEKAALRGTLVRGIATSMAANFFYTLLLIGFVVVLYFAGVDLLGLLQRARSG